MSEAQEVRAAFRRKSAELAVAALFLLLGAIVIVDSVRLGIGWREVDGPQPGYFPFYIGLIMCVASLINAAHALMLPRADNRTFVEVGQLKMVLAVLLPTAVYVVLVTWFGIYAPSALFIGFFMRWLGKYAWWKVVLVSVATPVALYLVFELWFQVPLPKGPLENLLGLG
jgi:putative tricarboxylic transport membrane protein